MKYMADKIAGIAAERGIEMYNGLSWELYLACHWKLSGLSLLQREMVESALLRGDEDEARSYIVDFKGRFATISKFVPGQHFHVLGKKFDSYREATVYARYRGFATDGLKEVFVYQEGL